MDALSIETILNWVGILLVSAALLGGGAMVAVEQATAARRRARLKEGGVIGARKRQRPLSQTILDPIRKMGDGMVIRDPAQLSLLRARLAQAGFMGKEAVAVYLGARMAAILASIVGMVMLSPWAMKLGGLAAPSIAATLVIIAMLAPDRFVRSHQVRREREYREGFPDMLDLLVASVEAGLSLDASVVRVRDELGRRYPILAEQLGMLTLELRAGKARKDAWAAFAQRLGIDEARSLATMLRQAEEMGTSLGETLAIFSGDMRAKRMLRAEELAMALPAKLMVPLILFIFPCLLGVLILPAAFRISQTLIGG